MLTQWLQERSCYGRTEFPPCRSFVSRLTLKQMLSGHTGCVNTLRWSPDASLMISGSDDRRVLLWRIDQEKSAIVHDIPTEHRGNIFDAQLNEDQMHLATCAADGTVTVVDGVCNGFARASRVVFNPLANMTPCMFMANKLSWLDNNVFMVSFGDGTVRQIDIRLAHNEMNKVMAKFSGESRSIEICPFDTTKVTVGGADIYVRVIDRRYFYVDTSEQNLIARFSHPKFDHSASSANHGFARTREINISSLEWARNGHLLANFRSADMVLFDGYRAIQHGFHGNSTDYVVQTYTGRENVQTIAKEAKFIFNDRYIMSGGDCGGAFIWDIHHSEPVRRLQADRCCVNCVLPHARLEYILSSGIDNEIKMWDLSHERRPLNEVKVAPTAPGTFSDRMRSGPGNLMDDDARERLKQCERMKALGNDLVKAGNHDGAVEKYDEALRSTHFVSHNATIEVEQKELRTVLHTNQALCHYQLKNFRSVIESCDRALEFNAQHTKALFRKTQAYFALNELQTASDILKLISNGDASVTKLQKEIDQRMKMEYEREKQRCRRMFG